MLKASALYLVIVIALVIAVICSALLVAAYAYRLEYQQKFRSDALHRNLGSGINMLLSNQDTRYDQQKTFALFNGDQDSVTLKHITWGVYDIGLSKAFIQKDTLYQVLMMAKGIDSTKWAALYLIDEDRPLSVSGKTTIRGDAFIPKAGIREAYMDNQAYQGDKRLVIGRKHDSEKTLPTLNEQRLQQITAMFGIQHFNDSLLLKKDSVFNSFLNPTRTVNFKKHVQTLSQVSLSGNIMLFSDTTIIIDGTAVLNNILIFARAISVKQGFHGQCQLFARDSISVERDCDFEYPSCLGIVRHEAVKGYPEKIFIGENSRVNGLVFTYEKEKNQFLPMIDLGKNVIISGQVYAQGMLNYKAGVILNGSVFASRFIYQTAYTRYENYLVNATIDGPALSRYYLASGLMPVALKQSKVLQWLEAN